jgi:predicted nucleic acid-binding protein
MSETLYLETSILGYLTARSAYDSASFLMRDPILAAKIEVTRNWWQSRQSSFTVYVSRAVINEIARGDAEIAALRLDLVRGFPLLSLNQAVRDLAAEFLLKSNLPPKADIDALHIAAATVHGLNYWLTWNCKHIANAQIQKKLRSISFEHGYELPIICIPYELLGE